MSSIDYTLKADPCGEYLIRLDGDEAYYPVSEEDLDTLNCGEISRRTARRGYRVACCGATEKLIALTHPRDLEGEQVGR